MRASTRSMTACLIVAALTIAAAPAVAEQVYGKGVSSEDTVLISSILDQPDQYLGKTVRVEGTVVACCKARGCWIDLASDGAYQKMQVKVNDGEIVFPMSLMGERVRAEGTVEAVPLTHDQAVSYLEGEASCQNEKFDPASVPADGITIYRLHGTGAVALAAEAPAAASGGVEQEAAAGQAAPKAHECPMGKGAKAEQEASGGR